MSPQSKDFEFLDLDPPNNPTSHYGACHFGYNLALIGQLVVVGYKMCPGCFNEAQQEI